MTCENHSHFVVKKCVGGKKNVSRDVLQLTPQHGMTKMGIILLVRLLQI